MASTFTPNVQLEEPARGDDVGTWDTPVNSNMTTIDLLAGAIATISLNNTNVVLSAAQFRSKQITFNSTLTGTVNITFPTSFTKSYEIQNLCTGSSAFVVILTTSASSGAFVACPPGAIVDIVNDGVNLKFKNLGPIGTYVDYAGSALPLWVQKCGTNGLGFAPTPYLACDGSTFSSSIYPALAAILNGTTLPDTRGRFRLSLDAGTGRVSSGVSNVSGNTLFAGGGDQSLQSHIHGVNDPSHAHTGGQATSQNGFAGGNPSTLWFGGAQATGAAFTGISIQATGNGSQQNMPPLLVSGITMIRSF